MTYRLAPMSPSILVLTVVLLALPLALLGLAALLTPLLLGLAVFILAIYAWASAAIDEMLSALYEQRVLGALP